MGVVKIIENLDNGRYKVEVIKDTDRIKIRVEQLEKQIQKLQQENSKYNEELVKVKADEAVKRVEYDNEAIGFNNLNAQIETLNQQLATNETLLDSTLSNLAIKQNTRTSILNQLGQGGLTPQEEADLQSQLIAVNQDISALNALRQEYEKEIKAIIKSIDELSNPSKLIAKMEKLNGELYILFFKRQQLKKSIEINNLIIKRKQKIISDYNTKKDDADIRDVWITDYRIDLPADETLRQSIDIHDESNLILISPYTYQVVQKDVDEKISYIAEKVSDKDKLDLEAGKKQIEINALQDELDLKNTELVQTSILLANIDISIPQNEENALRNNLKAKIEELKKQIKELIKEIAKQEKIKKKYEAKSNLLGKRILQLNDELTDLQQAVASSNPLEPAVTEKTRRFQPTQSSSPEAVFYNKSLLPGFQKWRPTYRLAVITAIHANDLCDVTLEDALSNQQFLDINQAKDLTNVRIKYGVCNSAVFNVGDRVVVQFEEKEQDKPVVIGFEDNPKPCGGVVCLPSSDTAPVGWGLPLTNTAGELINPPLGTIGGGDPKALISFGKSPNYSSNIRRNVNNVGGCCYWGAKRTLSWHGPLSNAVAPPIQIVTGLSTLQTTYYFGYQLKYKFLFSWPLNNQPYYIISPWRFNNRIYQNGKIKIATGSPVLGAGILDKFIVYVTNIDENQDMIMYLDENGVEQNIGVINFTNPPNFYAHRTNIYCFSPDGTKAASVIHSFTAEEPTQSQPRIIEWAHIPRIVLRINQTTMLPEVVSVDISVRMNSIINRLTRSIDIQPDGLYTTRTITASNSTVRNSTKILSVGYDSNNSEKELYLTCNISGGGSSTYILEPGSEREGSGGDSFTYDVSVNYDAENIVSLSSTTSVTTYKTISDNVSGTYTQTEGGTETTNIKDLFLLYFSHFHSYKAFMIHSLNKSVSQNRTWTNSAGVLVSDETTSNSSYSSSYIYYSPNRGFTTISTTNG